MTNPAAVSVGGNFTFWVHLSDMFERIIDTTFLGSQFWSKWTQLTDLYQLSSPDSLLDKSMTFFHSDFLSCVKSRKIFTCRKCSRPLFFCTHLDFGDGHKWILSLWFALMFLMINCINSRLFLEHHLSPCNRPSWKIFQKYLKKPKTTLS